MEKIKVSILVPVYNVEKFIKRCVCSLFEQSYTNLEYVFVNDCTPDDSWKILLEVIHHYPHVQKQVKLIQHECNKGLAAARKTALQHATGDYILNVDSDDYVAINMVERLAAEVLNQNADIVICDIYEITRKGKHYCHVCPSKIAKECLTRVLSGTLQAYLPNKLIRRDLYTKYRILPIPKIDMLEDVCVMYRLLYFAQTIAYVSEPLYYYDRSNQNSYSAVKMKLSYEGGYIALIRQMDTFRLEHNIKERSIVDAFCFFKARLLASILLYGSKNANLYLQNKELFNEVKLYHFFRSPNFPLHFKLTGLFLHYNIKWGISLLRKLMTLSFRIYKRIRF